VASEAVNALLAAEDLLTEGPQDRKTFNIYTGSELK
jgi:hypothetical protein